MYFDVGAMFAFNFLSPLYAGVPAVLAVLAWRLGRRPAAALTTSPAGRVALRVLLVVVVTAGLVWMVFAYQGTPAGEPGIGRCPASNVPPWWPGWIPA
ncbi:hypothetical protein ABT026_15265 [Streptomyces sp. NPDC002734]|uniref:hypothetical protein n=1 Tax=Streptomyces sp. NPDC002734 TaxID=3154426 RepID=UPI003324BE99